MEVLPEVDIIQDPTPSYSLSYKTIPHFILFFIIFVTQLISKKKEADINDATQSKEIEKGTNLQIRFLIIYHFAKAADWFIAPFIFEFFETYHALPINRIAQLISVSFISGAILGPFFVGYLNDKANKKIACLFYGIALMTSLFTRMLKKSFNAWFFSQICFGVSSSVLFTSFENWLVSEAKSIIKDEKALKYVLSSTFER